MGRSILAVLVGLVAASLTVLLIEIASHWLLPVPPGMDVTSRESMATAMHNLPVASLLAILVAWAVGSFIGGWVAASIARTHQTRCAIIVAILIILSGIANMLMIPHPIWIWIGGLFLPLPCALAGARLAPAKPAVTTAG